MKRNSRLIDDIIETVHASSSEWISLDDLRNVATMATPDTEPDVFQAHVRLCVEAGWLTVQSNPLGVEKPDIVRLTWLGHNAVDAGSGRWQ